MWWSKAVVSAMWVLIAVLGLVSLAGVMSFGLATLPLAVAGAVVMVLRPSGRRALATLVAAMSVGPLLVALINRRGPGHVCRVDADGLGCTDYLDPRPWLAAGVVLLVLAAVLWRRRPA